MSGWKTLALTAALVPVCAGMLGAQQPAPAENATISMDRARSIALARVPNNEGVKSVKLETRDGVPVYEVYVETPGPGHQQVRVNARTGAIVSDRHEDDMVGGAANKVGGAAKDAGHATEHAAKTTGNAVEKGAKVTGKAVEKGAKATGKAVDKGAKATGKAVDRVFTGDDARNAHPRITEARARAIALKRFPTATKVTDVDLERENGLLVWTADVHTPGPGHEEVTIDATTGRILRTHHEVGIAGKAKQAVEKVVH